MSLALPSDHAAIVLAATDVTRSTNLCLACGGTLPPALERSASLRCHDCRDAAAPIRRDLVARLPALLQQRLRAAA
jgi:hypothetical protein